TLRLGEEPDEAGHDGDGEKIAEYREHGVSMKMRCFGSGDNAVTRRNGERRYPRKGRGGPKGCLGLGRGDRYGGGGWRRWGQGRRGNRARDGVQRRRPPVSRRAARPWPAAWRW